MALYVKRFGIAIVAVGVLWILMALSASPAWAQAALTVDKSGSPGTVIQGENVTYTIDVTNSGDATADLVTLEDNLPDGFNFVSADSTNGSCVEGDESTTTLAGDVVCELGPLAMGETATVTIVATARGGDVH